MKFKMGSFSVALMLLVPSWAQGASCPDPNPGDYEFKKGFFRDSEFDFTFISYLDRYRQNGEFVFGRCVFNKHARPVWIEWEKLGLTGGTTKSADSYAVEYEKDDDDKVTRDSVLWYGPRPEKLKPDAIFRPQEVTTFDRFLDERILPAQFSDVPSLKAALISPQAFEGELANLRKNNADAQLRSFAYGRVALPVNDEVFDRFRKGDPDISDDDFYAVKVVVRQTYHLEENSLAIRPELLVQVDGADIGIFSQAENKISFKLEGSSAGIYSLFGGFDGLTEYEKPELRFSPNEPIRVAFPVSREPSIMVIDFGRYAGLAFQIMTPRSN